MFNVMELYQIYMVQDKVGIITCQIEEELSQ